jgi:hypothetical protein
MRSIPSPHQGGNAPWAEELAAVYLGIGGCLLGVMLFCPDIVKKIRLSGCATIIRDFRSFAICVVLFWPGLWFFERTVAGGSEKDPNQPPETTRGKTP